MNRNHPPCHRRFEKALALLAADSLAPVERAETRQHLAGCPDCRAACEELRSVCQSLTAGTGHPGARLSPEFHARLADAILKPSRPARRPWLAPVAAAACAIIGFLLWPAFRFHQPASRPATLTSTNTPPAPEQSLPPTLLVYQRAARLSDEAFAALLTRQAANILPPDHKPGRGVTAFDAYRRSAKLFPESL